MKHPLDTSTCHIVDITHHHPHSPSTSFAIVVTHNPHYSPSSTHSIDFIRHQPLTDQHTPSTYIPMTYQHKKSTSHFLQPSPTANLVDLSLRVVAPHPFQYAPIIIMIHPSLSFLAHPSSRRICCIQKSFPGGGAPEPPSSSALRRCVQSPMLAGARNGLCPRSWRSPFLSFDTMLPSLLVVG